jgi:hypothetical protein
LDFARGQIPRLHRGSIRDHRTAGTSRRESLPGFIGVPVSHFVALCAFLSRPFVGLATKRESIPLFFMDFFFRHAAC